ncbi:MAG: adenosylcobalamin-dependent ribonucleoside-diphosphate reductase [Candidatus Marinimicrobia bacterium]|nr:adenosylcobalamin-dependent ribonucleoside-diphosphate reductase [Candidatus Neomarinimicrobiota bacterium]
MKVVKPKWNKERKNVLNDRYLYDNEKNWDELVERIAKNVQVDCKNILKEFKFVPAGRILAGLGTDTVKTFFNCYVLAFEDVGDGIDSRSAIMDLFTRVFEISARGGGVGINWSPLRPKGSDIKKVRGESSGSVSWMEALDALAGRISQGGSRRGAYMFGLETWHPDIERFITIKKDREKIQNANLSVFVSDEFMKAVKNDEEWDLVFPELSFEKYDKEWNGDIREWQEKDYPIKHYKTVDARQLFNLITDYTHDNGEPGLVFLERYNKTNIANQDEKIIATNPCGEQGLSANSVCNLGSINLTQFIDIETGEILFDNLRETVHTGVEFLDEIIDVNPYYLDKAREHQYRFRKIGLGILGLADFLILKNIKYGSPESYKLMSKVMAFIQNETFRKSALLAKEKGAAPVWDEYMLDNQYIQQLDANVRSLVKKHGLRNTRLLTVAPTGSTGILAGVSSGIEPNFAFELMREDRLGERKVIHWLPERKEELGLPDDVFVEASDLTSKQHVDMQATIQKYVDSSISKTINAPNKATKEDTREVYLYAYEKGCKGITYYRDGSRQGVLRKQEKEKKKEEVSELEKMFKKAGNSVIPHDVNIPKEPPVQLYKRRDNHSRKWYFFIAFADRDYQRPFALFIKTNNYASGDVADWIISKMERLMAAEGIDEELIDEQVKKYSGQSNVDKIARTISMSLRHNIPIKDIVDLLDRCDADFSSLVFHIKKLLEMFIPDGTEAGERCPECDGQLVYQEGCKFCPSCNWSKCD